MAQRRPPKVTHHRDPGDSPAAAVTARLGVKPSPAKPTPAKAGAAKPRRAPGLGPKTADAGPKASAGPRRTPARAARAKTARTRRGWLFAALKWSAVAAIWLVILGIGGLVYVAHDLPPVDQVQALERRPTIVMVDRTGAEFARGGDVVGAPVDSRRLPRHVTDAVVAIEDRRFFWHPGVDPIGIARAARANWQAGRTVEGGSTITQQLAKLLFLTPDRTLRRKMQEAVLALWLDARYSKHEILSAYLNRVYLGAGTYGLDAAARTYFGVPAAGLSVRQAAVLAGLLKAPSSLSPFRDPAAAKARSDLVLDAMVRFGALTGADRAAVPAELGLVDAARHRQAGYFQNFARDQLPDLGGTGDRIVTTSLDLRLQRLAETVVAAAMADIRAQGGDQATLVALDPNGAVRAMVGGADFAASQFNRAVQARRQPGSAFKPLIYLAGLEHGLRPTDLVDDRPFERAGWAPRNFDAGFRGAVPLHEALRHSLNLPVVHLLDRVGIDAVIGLSRRFGLAVAFDRNDLSVALGTAAVSPLDMARLYAGFANGGQAVFARAIDRVADRDGTVLWQAADQDPINAARPHHVRQLNGMLAAVIGQGTAQQARIGRPAAGKTGTTQDHRDAWFIGFTADLTVAVWVGRDDGGPTTLSGGGVPAQIWRAFMTQAHGDSPPRPIPMDQPWLDPDPAVVAARPAPVARATPDGADIAAAPEAGSGRTLTGFLRRLLGDDDGA